jgi:heptosyltransferase I
MQILLVKTSSLGDVIHNLPVVTDIVRHVPLSQIDWVVEEGFSDIPRLHPAVRRVFPVAMRRWRSELLWPATWREIIKIRHALREQPYDIILDTQGLIKSGLLAFLARGPVHGQDSAGAREPLAARFYDHVYRVARGRNAVVRNRDLAAQVFGYPLPDTFPNYGIFAPAAVAVGLPAKFVMALHATSRDSKLWPEANWLALGTALAKQGLTLVLPWGSASEERRARAIAAGVPGAIVLPRLGLRELAAILGRSQGVVGVDTGLVHLAAALGRPTVAIYTDTSPALTGVLAADAGIVRNLGDRGKAPTVEDVRRALHEVGIS